MYKLLVVDDERAIVEGLAEMIGASGLPFKEIMMAYSAAEALGYHNEFHFDIILTDIRMPKIDGLEMFEKIKAMNKACKVIFLSGYSDFEYARRAMKLGASDYILKLADDEEVISCLRKVISQVENEREQMISLEKTQKMLKESLIYAQGELFRKLLTNKSEYDDKILNSRFSEFQVPFNLYKKVFSISMRIDEFENPLSLEDETLIQLSVQNMLDELLDWTCNVLSFPAETRIIALVIQEKVSTGDECVFKSLQVRLSEVQDVIYRLFGVVTSFSIMKESVEWSRWPGELSRMITAMRLQLGKGLIIVPVEQTVHTGYGVYKEIIKESVEAINSKDIVAFEKSLDHIHETDERSSKGAVNSMASTFMAICSHLINTALQYNVGSSLSEDDTEKLSNFYMHKNLAELKRFLVGILKKIAEAMEEYQRNPTGELIEEVKNYIKHHLGEYLSLEILSQKAHVNPSYLSRIFKQYTKEQLSAYITRMKMEYAVKLLRGDEGKVQDIAQKVGFDNPNYFAKVFRRAYGMSPQEYRIHQIHE